MEEFVSTAYGGAIALAVLGGATAFYLFSGNSRKRTADDVGTSALTAEQRQKRLLKLQQSWQGKVNSEHESTEPLSSEKPISPENVTKPRMSIKTPRSPSIEVTEDNNQRTKKVKKLSGKIVTSIPSVPVPSSVSVLPGPESAPFVVPDIAQVSDSVSKHPPASHRFQLKKDIDTVTSKPENDSSTPKRKSPPLKSKSPTRVNAVKSVETLITAILRPGTPLVPTSTSIAVRPASPDSNNSYGSSRILKGRLTIELFADSVIEDISLVQIVDSFSSLLARQVLECCVPHSSCIKNQEFIPASTVKNQLEWLQAIYEMCDPFHGFSHEVERIFSIGYSSTHASDEAPLNDDPLKCGRALMNAFRSACVFLAKVLLAPHNNMLQAAVDSEDDDLPPLFADEKVVAKTSSDEADDVAVVLFDLMRKRTISSQFFYDISSDFEELLRSFLTRAMKDIIIATNSSHNIFTRADSAFYSSFPFSSLDAIRNAAPALSRLLAQNIASCISLGVDVEGVDVMKAFLLTDLICITQSLSFDPVLSLHLSPAAVTWAKLLQSPKNVDDVDRIIYSARSVVMEVFKHILSVDKGRHKKDVMEFFSLILRLSNKRLLGRYDDMEGALRGFEPSGRVISRHFILGTADLVVHLVSQGGVKVFDIETFFERRQKELADVEVVKSLTSGELCKCNFDVFLMFYSTLMMSALDKESLRQAYVIRHMRQEISHSRLPPFQVEELQIYERAYSLSSSCQSYRPDSLIHVGTMTGLFCQYLIRLLKEDTAVSCFRVIESSPHNLYQSLSFAWSSLSRIQNPTAEQEKSAESVVYLTTVLLNRADLLVDIKQQNHLVNILNSIGGRILHDHSAVDVPDECLSKNDDTLDTTHETSTSSRWGKENTFKIKEKSAYYGSKQDRGPFVGAIFDSERNVRNLPVALARLYISSQSVEGWDADKDTSFDKFDLRMKISRLLAACIDHPIHAEAVLDSLHNSVHDDFDSVLGTLFTSVIDQNTSNFSFLNSIIRTAIDSPAPQDEMKKKYNFVKLSNYGVVFLLKLCEERTVLGRKRTMVKLSNQILQLFQISELLYRSSVDLGLSGTRDFLTSHIHQLVTCMLGLGGDTLMKVLEDCSVIKGVRLHVPSEKMGLNDKIAARWAHEDSIRAAQQAILRKDGDSDDHDYLKAEVQRTIDDDNFISNYHETISEVCSIDKSVESVLDIPGYRFKSISEESLSKGTPRPHNILKAWKAVSKCLANANDVNNFHPNGTILIKYLESDSSCARAVISLNMDTPYAFGLFFFDIWLPPDYPNIPPLCELVTNGDESFMLSPNLYSCGKVCMSLLNTAQSGSDIEKWQPGKSTVAQVLLTIQTSLLGDPEPLTKEGKLRGSPQSLAYNEEKHFETVCWGMIDALDNGANHMGPEFGVFILCHFSLLREQIRLLVRSWWLMGGKNWRLERMFILLLQKLSDLPPISAE